MRKVFVFGLLTVALIFVGCNSAEYNEAMELPREVESVPEMYELLTTGEMSDEEVHEVQVVIDDLLVLSADTDDPKESVELLSVVLERPELSDSGKERVLNLIKSNEEEIVQNRISRLQSIEKGMRDGVRNEDDREMYVNNINRYLEREEITQEQADELLVYLEEVIAQAMEREKAQRKWETGYFVDSFDERTGETFLYQRVEGTFSNSATTDSELGVRTLFADDYFSFDLYEYGFGNTNARFYGGFVFFLARNENGEEVSLGETLRGGETMDGFQTQNRREYDQLRQFFERSEEVRVYIKGPFEETYRFTLDTKYFNTD